MAASAPVPANSLPAAVQCIAAAMAGFSLEATRPTDAEIAALGMLTRGTGIYISAVPGRPAQDALFAATRLRAAGFEPVPHVAVRNFASAHDLDEFLARLNGEAQVQRVLVIGGDRAEYGPFRSALDAIDTGVFRRRGIRAIGIAGYPEGHPRIGREDLDRALTEKIAAAEGTGLAVEIVTQFCFDARAILDFIARLRAFGFEHPIRVGLAGPTGLAQLLRYATRCGVRASAQALATRAGLLRQMFAMAAPDDLVRAIANAGPAHVSLHLFSFGGLPASARWARAVADGHILIHGDNGFMVAPPQRDG